VSDADHLDADPLPVVMSSVRQLVHSARAERRGLRIGGADTRMSGRWPALAASIAFVFACFFLIGHASRSASGGFSRTEAPSTLQAATRTAEIPGALNSAPPIESGVPIAIAATVPRRAHRQQKAQAISIRAPLTQAAPTQPLTGELTQRALPVSTPQASSAPAPQVSAPAPAPAATRAPTTAPTHSSSGGRSGSGGGGSGGGGTHSSGGGGSFDSSE
jgi:uncharacterized membrane protein YgcG